MASFTHRSDRTDPSDLTDRTDIAGRRAGLFLPLDVFLGTGIMLALLKLYCWTGPARKVGEPGSTGFFIPHEGKTKML
jgi:hypothetical protein